MSFRFMGNPWQRFCNTTWLLRKIGLLPVRQKYQTRLFRAVLPVQRSKHGHWFAKGMGLTCSWAACFCVQELHWVSLRSRMKLLNIQGKTSPPGQIQERLPPAECEVVQKKKTSLWLFCLSCTCLKDIKASEDSSRFTAGTVYRQVPNTWYRTGSECGVEHPCCFDKDL